MISIETKKQKVILVVDDVAENLELLARNLQRLGYKVLLATSGAQALEIAHAKLPELILLDVQMPGMSGFEVCTKLKEDESTKHIPIIFITAKTEQDSVVEAFSLGAVDYVLKPFYNEELFARVNTHLRLKELSDEIKEKNEKLEQYVDMVERNIAISQTDRDGIVVYVSDALCEMSGFAKDELIGHKHCCFKSGCTPQIVYLQLWNTITNGNQWRGELLDKKKNGDFFWADLTITPKLDENGEVVGYMAIWLDVTNKKKVEELVVTDHLTRLFNRRHLEAELNSIILGHNRRSEDFGFLMIDIDFFKLYNDFYGHHKGDEALVAAAESIKSCLSRSGDSAFRFGGEEFCVVLSNIDKNGLTKVANDILKALQDMHIEHQKSPIGYLSFSIGGALINPQSADFDATIKSADKMLYEAKESGRNRVCLSF